MSTRHCSACGHPYHGTHCTNPLCNRTQEDEVMPDLLAGILQSLRPMESSRPTEPRPCFCGSPDDRSRVHRAHECVAWSTKPEESR